MPIRRYKIEMRYSTGTMSEAYMNDDGTLELTQTPVISTFERSNDRIALWQYLVDYCQKYGAISVECTKV